ncbi:MAG: C40 family peptidase, partial [Candidatus Adiutrix sp.]
MPYFRQIAKAERVCAKIKLMLPTLPLILTLPLMVIILSGCTSSMFNFLDPPIVSNNIYKSDPPKTSYRVVQGDVIDHKSSTRGLNGHLSTGRAGQVFLADNSLGSPKTGQTVAVADDFVDFAYLNFKSGVTAPLLTAAYGQSGRPYKSGGQNPNNGFDAAGFTRWVYGQQGINLPRDIKRQATSGQEVAKSELRPGDLLIYRDLKNKASYHVGIYTG